VLKRCVDVLISVVLLLGTLPILALAALLIYITSPGPILFRQTRMGRGFRPFRIIKLRSMAHAKPGLAYTLGADPRITWIGKWLRRSKVDELPQLWNVLRGEMSLVGPRPVLPELTYEFRSSYRQLLTVRPGLTDPASLKYSQEAKLLSTAREPMHFFKTVVTPDKLRISIQYLETATVVSDSFIMVMTAAICVFPSLSSLYGQLPPTEPSLVLQGERAAQIGRSAASLPPRKFGPRSVPAPQQVVRAAQAGILPWIPSRPRTSGPQSTSPTAPGRTSQL
jgi:lipopolysaccharide/colanic/teichoic acid biosynthesis glycosyltransferase